MLNLRSRCTLFPFILAALALAGLRLVYLELRNKRHIWQDPCITPPEDREKLRQAMRAILRASSGKSHTWWLDYGTLLGAWRLADVMAYDFDLDLGYLAQDLPVMREVAAELAPLGLVLDLEDTTIWLDGVRIGDVEPWHRHGDTLSRDRDLSQRHGLVKLDRLICDDFPAAWVDPVWSLQLAGDFYPCPNHVERFLRRRYPTCRMNLRICFPFRQKCWFCADYWREVWRIWTCREAPVVRRQRFTGEPAESPARFAGQP